MSRRKNNPAYIMPFCKRLSDWATIWFATATTVIGLCSLCGTCFYAMVPMANIVTGLCVHCRVQVAAEQTVEQ